MIHNPATIVTVAERLMVEIERVVAVFPHKHKYLLGQDLRRWSQQAAMVVQRAWRVQANKPVLAGQLDELIGLLDRIQLGLQTGYRLQAFTSSGAFESLAHLASDVGRQAGGWKKQTAKHLNGQSASAFVPKQRPETLSTRAASQGAQG